MAEAHQPGRESSVPEYASQYGADYYLTRFGPDPYDRSTTHWLEFFGGIASEIIRSLKPRNVFDAGCACGFLVEAFWDRGVEAGGVDVSEYAIAHLRPDMQPYCRVGSLTDPIGREYDLITCIEVLEHVPAGEVDQAIANLCRSTGRILFSSTPGDFDEPTHVSVRPVMGWLRAFQAHGFVPDLLYDASFIAPHAFLLRRQTEPMPEETLALFQVKVQCRVEVVDKLVRLIQAAKDIQELRTRSEAAERERDQWKHKAEERGYTIEEWICHDGERRREMRRAEDEATRCLHEASEQLEKALRNLSEAKQETVAAVSQVRELSGRLTELSERHEEVERLARHINAEYASPAWQFIKQYRNAMNKARSRHPLVRKVVEPAILRVLRALGAVVKAAPVPVAPVSGPPPAAAAAPAAATSPDGALYAQWIRENEPDAAGLAAQARIAAELAYRPRISIVTPVYKVPLDVVREAILSVQAQTYDNWELCLAHAYPDAVDVRQYLESASQSDPRIQVALLDENRGISGNSNVALTLASGEFIALLDHDDTLAPFALFEVVKALNDDPTIDFLYSDKDQLTADAAGARRVDPLFKPRWSPEIMLCANYVTHLTVMRSQHVQALGGWRKETDGAQDWDLFFRVMARSRRIRHIPKVLYHWRRIATSVAARGLDAKPYAARAQFVTLRDYCQAQGWNVEVQEPDAEGAILLKWKTSQKVSIIFVAASAAAEAISRAEALLATVGDTVGGTVGNPAVEILVPLAGDAASSKDARVKPVKVASNATQAERITQAVNQSAGPLLVFFDQSVTPAGPGWLQELTGPLQNPGVGLVGAKLLDARNDSIRHAGIVFRQDGRLQYIFSGQPEHYYEVFGGPGWFRNWTAVSGACMAMRREVWDQTGGFSGDIRYPRLDIELCLRAQLQLGLRVVYNPHARLYQSAPSGMEAWLNVEGENAGAPYISASFPDGDPYFNPNLNCQNGEPRVGRPRQDAASLDYAAESRILVTAFDFTRAQLNESRRGAQAAGKGQLEQITWFLPEFANPFYGGVHTILRFAAHFAERHAVGSRFVILGQAHPRAMLRRITAAFPELGKSDVRVINSDLQLDDLPASDAAIATLWTTAYSLLKFRRTRRKFYFIQDYEPLFYPAGSTSALVEATYDFGFTGICNTISLKEIYQAQGGKAEYFDPSIDASIFYRSRGERGNRKPYLLFCYARPGHPRNCFELLMEALKRLKQRLGEDVCIVTAGAEWSPAAYGVEGVIRNLGLLGYRETGALYRACDAGVVAMKTRHPSYLPMELMACGAAVVTNRNPYTGWLLRDGENCVLAETSPSALAESLEEVLRDTALRARLAEASAEVVGRYSDWAAQAEKIYQFMVAQC